MNEYERIFPSNSGGVGCLLDTAAGTTGRRTWWAWRARRRTAAELAVAIQLAPGEDMRTTVF